MVMYRSPEMAIETRRDLIVKIIMFLFFFLQSVALEIE